MARVVKRSVVISLLCSVISAPAFSFSLNLWGHRDPKPQLIVDGHQVIFTVAPKVDHHVLRAPADFVRTLGADFTATPGNDTIAITASDGHVINAKCERTDDRYFVDVKDVAEKLGADTNWDDKHATLTLRAKVLSIGQQGGNLNVVTSYPVYYTTGALSGPSRIYVDLSGAILPESPSTTSVNSDGIVQIRAKQIDANTVRIALDLTHVARVAGALPSKQSAIHVATSSGLNGAPTPPTDYVAIAPLVVSPVVPPVQPTTVPAPGQSRPFNIVNISTSSVDGQFQATITTTGKPDQDSFKTYAIEKSGDKPDRFALDLPLAKMSLPRSIGNGPINVTDPVVKSVRWGTVHLSDKAYSRVVFDLAAATPFQVSVAPSPDHNGTVYTIQPGTGEVAAINVPTGTILPPLTGDNPTPIPPNSDHVRISDLTVIVDPGHGGKDGGAPGVQGLWEKDLTLAISKDLRDALIAQGAKVIMTRDDDTFIPLATRSQLGIDNKADYFISVHCDSGSGRNAQEGSTVYYHGNNPTCHGLSERIAARLKESNSGIDSDGTRTDYVRFPGYGFSVLRRSPEPAVLVECGYVNNDADAKLLSDDATQKLIAASIVAGLKDFVGNKVASK